MTDRETQVTRVLRQLEELAPQLERTRRDVWLTRFRNTMAFVAALAFILAGIALVRVGTVARNDTQRATAQAQQSRHISDCLNNILGIRAKTTTEETTARKNYAIAQKHFAQGQTRAFQLIFAQNAKNTPILIKAASDGTLAQVLKQLSKQPNPGGKLLLSTERTFAMASDKFVAELTKIEEFRQKHPLGAC